MMLVNSMLYFFNATLWAVNGFVAFALLWALVGVICVYLHFQYKPGVPIDVQLKRERHSK